MTLLTRGITSSGQGLSYLDKAIQKSEAADKEFQNNLNTYNDLLSGVKSGGTYLGQGSRNILNEYAKAFESAIDSYAVDPSAENEQRIQELKLQTNDFYNRAVAARQNSIAQLNALRADPSSYATSLDKAQEKFASIEDANPTARFDMDTMTMYVGDPSTRSEMSLGNIGYYNGSDPMFFEKAAQLGELRAEGEYAATAFDRYKGMIGTDAGKEKFIEGFMETARPKSSAYQETAIYNYLTDEMGVDLTQITDETELVERISEVKNDASKLTAALRHMGELEYNYALGIRAAQSAAKVQETYNNLFNRQQMYRGERDAITFDNYLGTDLAYIPEEAYQDQFLGARGVNTFKTALGADAVVGLKTKNQDGIIEKLRGMNMLADGSMVLALDVETPMTDPDTNEELPSQFKREFRVVEPGSELYENVVSYIGSPAIVNSMYEQAIANKARVEKSREDQITSYLYAQSQLDDVPEEYKLPSPRDIAEAQRVDKQAGKTGPTGIERGLTPSTVESEAGLISQGPFSAGPLQQVTQAERDMDRRLRERIKEENPDMTDQQFNAVVEEMNKQGITVKLSRTRNFLQRLLGRPEADLLRGVDLFNEVKASMEERDLMNQLDPETQAYRDQFEEMRGRDYNGGTQASEIAVSNTQDESQKQNFAETLIDLGVKNGVPFPEVMASQVILESRWGNSESAPNNVFGIKYTKSLLKDLEKNGIDAFRGSKVSTQEEEGGELKEIQTNFMGFRSLEDAVKAYKYIIESRGAYKEARKAENALDFAKALQGTYATDTQYAQKIQEIATDSLGVDLSQIGRQF